MTVGQPEAQSRCGPGRSGPSAGCQSWSQKGCWHGPGCELGAVGELVDGIRVVQVSRRQTCPRTNPNPSLKAQSQICALPQSACAVPILRTASWGTSLRAQSLSILRFSGTNLASRGSPECNLRKQMAQKKVSYEWILFVKKDMKITKLLY